jgi:hypothetical protein
VLKEDRLYTDKRRFYPRPFVSSFNHPPPPPPPPPAAVPMNVSHDIIIFVETKLDDLNILNVPNGYSYITKNIKKCVKNQVV